MDYQHFSTIWKMTKMAKTLMQKEKNNIAKGRHRFCIFTNSQTFRKKAYIYIIIFNPSPVASTEANKALPCLSDCLVHTMLFWLSELELLL